MKTLLIVFATVLTLVSCNDDEPVPFNPGTVQEPEPSEEIPGNPPPASTAMFTSFAHGLAGSASLYTLPDSGRFLRLENFTMSAGPDVYVFLSKSNNFSQSNTIELAKLTMSYSQANLSIDVGPEVDLVEYPFVLVYCVQFNSLFGFAELN